MRLTSLSVTNFRAIRKFEIGDLQDVVVIAGPNGCGKSAILHAFRLLKSSYGGYKDNEYQQWFNEFQIKLDPLVDDFARLIRNRSIPLKIAADVLIAQREADYLRDHGRALLEALAWQEIAPRAVNWSSRQRARVTPEVERFRPRVDERAEELFRELQEDLGRNVHSISLTIGLDGRLVTTPSPVVQLLFSTYDPANLGIIEYHADTRQYDRASMGNLTVNFGNLTDRRSQQALYQTQQKYQNLRSDLLTNYLTGLVRSHAGAEEDESTDLLETLKELFRSFFPGKEFVGAVPKSDGTVDFPIRLPDGSEHDISDLSAGEKEIVFGYLRLHGLNPRDSILLFDEPELHLNPRLISGLTEFYSRFLGAPRGNQLWMTTHSDTLLREAIGKPGYSVYHMRAPTADSGNQAVLISEEDELERAIIDIVGDLAAYQPGNPIVLVEGGGTDEFDLNMIHRLFPEIAGSVNLVSAGSKQRVRDLYELLVRLREDSLLSFEVFGIVDRDGGKAVEEPRGVFTWDRYHIENYLLEDEFIYQVVSAISMSTISSPAEVGSALESCARLLIPRMVAESLRARVNRQLVSCVDLGGPPDADPSEVLSQALARSFERLDGARGELTRSALDIVQNEINQQLVTDLDEGTWRCTFAGRLVLKRFVDQYLQGVNYPVFRNLVLDRMANNEFQPEGMRAVLSRIRQS